MSNYERIKAFLEAYFSSKGIHVNLETDMRSASLNNAETPPVYLYNGENALHVLSMDDIAKDGYKQIKGAVEGLNNSPFLPFGALQQK